LGNEQEQDSFLVCGDAIYSCYGKIDEERVINGESAVESDEANGLNLYSYKPQVY
jgi:hypothetical protein